MSKKLCGAKTRAGTPCKSLAGQGTDHLGTGKCRLHGGASKGAPKGNKNAQKHGIYSRIFKDHEIDEAKEMQGSIETELAIARIQLMKLLEQQHKNGEKPQLDKIEETTITIDDNSNSPENIAARWVIGAKEAGEEYDPDGDEEFFDDESRRQRQEESKPLSRKRVYQRRDFQTEFTRLTALIARLEQQLIQMRKTKAEIVQIEALSKDKDKDDEESLTDDELDREIQELIGSI